MIKYNSDKLDFFNTKAQSHEDTKYYLERKTEWEWRKKPKINISFHAHFHADFFSQTLNQGSELNP
jgi:hypothetical protein